MNKLTSILILFLLIACSNEVIRNDASIDFADKQHVRKPSVLLNSLTKENAIVCFRFKNFLWLYCLGMAEKHSSKEKGLIKINYNAAFHRMFHKNISVFYNGLSSPMELKIKGEVEYPKEITENEKK